MKRHIAMAVLSTLVLSGCATNQAQQAQQATQTQQAAAAAKADADACYAEIGNDPRYASLKEKAPSQSEITGVHVANGTKPSAQEKALFAEGMKAAAVCGSKFDSLYAQYAPWQVPSWANFKARQTQAQAALLSGQVTWGEYNRMRQSSYATYQQESAAANAAQQQQQFQAQSLAAQQQAADRARADAAYNQFQQTLLQQQMIYNMNRPQYNYGRVQTSCQWVGHVWTCN